MAETVPVNKELLSGTVPVNKELLTGTVPVNKELLTERVPVNNLFFYLNKMTLLSTIFKLFSAKEGFKKENKSESGAFGRF